MKLFIVVNVDWFFLSHRLPIALVARDSGYDVTIITANTGKRAEIESYGLNYIELNFERSGTNIIQELGCVRKLKHIYKKYQPDLIHHVTLKVVLLGSIAAKLSGVKNVVNAISGFGYNFTDERKGLLQHIIGSMMRYAFKSKYFHFIFQNPDDIAQFSSLRLVDKKQIHLIKGSGVDLKHYEYSDEPDIKIIRFLLPARILYDKGIIEFITAAKLIKNQVKGKAQFIIAGNIDEENLAAIPKQKLESLLDEDYIQWIGHQKDILSTFKEAHVVVLPSYREGLPKSLIEACAVGRPIITTDAPGCRECVNNEENGFLVPLKDTVILAKKMLLLANDRTLRISMGKKSREKAEAEFSIDFVVSETMSIYQTVLMMK